MNVKLLMQINTKFTSLFSVLFKSLKKQVLRRRLSKRTLRFRTWIHVC